MTIRRLAAGSAALAAATAAIALPTSSAVATTSPSQAATTASAASAAPITRSISDPAGDEQVIGGKASPREKAAADILRFSYGRTSTRLWVRWKFRYLNRYLRQYEMPEAVFRAAHSRYDFNYDGYQAYLNHYYDSGKQENENCDPYGKIHVDYARHTVAISFPLSCFAIGWHTQTIRGFSSYNPSLDVTDHTRFDYRQLTPRP